MVKAIEITVTSSKVLVNAVKSPLVHLEKVFDKISFALYEGQTGIAPRECRW